MYVFLKIFNLDFSFGVKFVIIKVVCNYYEVEEICINEIYVLFMFFCKSKIREVYEVLELCGDVRLVNIIIIGVLFVWFVI